MWHKFNPNPHGSSVGDCAVRAVAAATGRSWEQAYISLALTGYALGDMPSANRTWGAYLQKQGYKRRMVEAGENLPLTETAVKAPACIMHREGSGLVTLRGLTNQCKARFKVSFGGNIAVPTGGTVGPISVALAVGGESLTSATAIVTPAAVENYFNVFVAAFIEVPRGCCVTVAVKNTSTQAVSIANSNLIVERVA